MIGRKMQALKLLFFKYYPRFVRMVGTAVKPLDFKFGACYHKGIETGASEYRGYETDCYIKKKDGLNDDGKRKGRRPVICLIQAPIRKTPRISLDASIYAMHTINVRQATLTQSGAY